jgi:dipeptidyl-peptidase 4
MSSVGTIVSHQRHCRRLVTNLCRPIQFLFYAPTKVRCNAVVWGVVFAIVVNHECAPVLAQDSDSFKPKSEAKVPPPLSLESLFHPQDKFDHSPELPSIFWIKPAEESSEPILVSKQDQAWVRLNLSTGKPAAWPVAEKIRRHLEALIPRTIAATAGDPKSTDYETDEERQEQNGSDQKYVEKINQNLDRVLRLFTHEDRPVLVRIDKRLVLIHIDKAPIVISSDAGQWNDETLDATGKRIAYTVAGDLYLREVDSGRTIRMTTDGSPTLLNGRLDWTYQEEIFGRGIFKGFWFSPDGNHLAMLRIDIGDVPEYTLSQSSHDRGEGPKVRYPKAGDPIPEASLWMFAVDGQSMAQPIEITFDRLPTASSADVESDPLIITGVWWHEKQSSLLFCVSNRKQTWRELRVYEPSQSEGVSRLLMREESPAWVEPPKVPLFLEDGSFVWYSQLPTGRGRLYHLSADGRVVTPITPEQTHVRSYWRDAESDSIFFTTDEKSSLGSQQHLYRVKTNGLVAGTDNVSDFPNRLSVVGGRANLSVQRLTDAAGWHDPIPSPDGRWWIDQFSTVDQPVKRTLHSAESLERSTIGASSNDELLIDQAELKLDRPLRETKTITITTSDGVPLPAMLLLPDAVAGRTRMPVLLEVYGGPQSPTAVNRWRGKRRLYRETLARRGIAVMSVDNRSSMDAGVGKSWPIRGQFGVVELADTLAAVEYLKSQYWVDPDAIGISGWSFGGFLTSYAMTHSDAFAAGIAGGSVTQWDQYDAFYTERYMGLPDENRDGYAKSSVVDAAGRLEGKLLLIHGEVDDNVHPSGTLRFADALQREGKLFEMMIYPSAAHAVHSVHQNYHLMRLTDDFLIRTLGRSGVGRSDRGVGTGLQAGNRSESISGRGGERPNQDEIEGAGTSRNNRLQKTP